MLWEFDRVAGYHYASLISRRLVVIKPRIESLMGGPDPSIISRVDIGISYSSIIVIIVKALVDVSSLVLCCS